MAGKQIRIVSFFMTDRCNLGCFYCRLKDQQGGGRGDVTPEVAAATRLAFPNTRVFRLTGWGEPTLVKSLPEVIEALQPRGQSPHVCLYTNALRLQHLEIDWRKVRRANVSMTTSDAESYKAECGSSRFDDVCENVRFLVSQGVRVALSFIIHKQNIEKIPDCVRLAKHLGVQAAQLQPIRGYPSDNPDEFWNKYALVKDPHIIHRLKAQVPIARKVGINFSMPRFFNRRHLVAQCRLLRGHYIAVGPGGSVAPCCGGAGPDFKFGNLLQEGAAVVRTPAMVNYRRTFKNPKTRPTECRTCHLNYQQQSWGVPCN